VFYARDGGAFIWVILGSILVNTTAAIWIERLRGTPAATMLLRGIVALNLLSLVTFKYSGFLAENLKVALVTTGASPFAVPTLLLPIGISFFTFQAISYVVDVYRGVTPAASLVDVAILQAFFPHLVAGPIVRANELLPQLRTPRDPRAVLAGPAIFLIVGGVLKKTVIADELARRVVDPVYSDPAAHSGGEITLAFYAFAAQIYCDFSGYTDIAIGLALLLGYQLPQNFNRPYLALSLQDFWRRWHMTLSRWLRDYLYIPLGGNREGRLKTYRNLMLTMLLGGLWHGASWTFLLWGGLHGAGLSAERWAREHFGGFHLPAWVAWLVTFQFVCIAWVFFRAPDLATAFDVLGGLGLSGPSPLVTLPLVLLVVVAVAVQALPPGWWRQAEAWLVARPVAVQGVAVGALLVISDAAVGQQGVAPFIYYQF
jgi:D-alanyl-lipoteichoic acid acyltransferase DltB (MBOAT superfamily)